MRHCAGVPELCVHQATLFVNRIGHATPSPNLLGTPKTRSISPTVSIGADLSAFADDETGRGALSVVFGVQSGGRMTGVSRTHAGQWGHNDPVRQLQFAHTNRSEEGLLCACDIHSYIVLKSSPRV